MSQEVIGRSEDTLKILIATDNHIGYMEKDSQRKEDSIRTFEEVLQIGRDNDVDFVLLGGDLYHDNKPSRVSLHGSIELFRKYCYGDKPCSVAFLSDPSVNFGHTNFKVVNYEDPNINVSMPVFSIHGNHDEPAGQSHLCSLDLLHSAGLVNYFGKISNLESISISPLLLQKGTSKLALYGLGNIRDERLHRLFENNKVKLMRPSEHTDDWFSIMVLHQNRSKHGAKNFIPENFLDEFLDLVVWGHEHECKADLSWNGVQNFYVTQPGSSIATSLSEGESKPKHVALLHVCGKDFKLDKVKLKTVRQFFIEDVVLEDIGIHPSTHKSTQKIEEHCTQLVEKFLKKAELERRDNPLLPDKPLIRLRVDYTTSEATTYDLFSIPRFGHRFIDRVANPSDMILFFRRRLMTGKNEGEGDAGGDVDVHLEGIDSVQVEDMVKRYFQKVDKAHRLSLLTEGGITEAVKEFVLKDERDAVSSMVNHQLTNTQSHLLTSETQAQEVEEEIEKYKMSKKIVREEKEEWRRDADEEGGEGVAISKGSSGVLSEGVKSKKGGKKSGGWDEDEEEDVEMNMMMLEKEKPKSSMERGRGRGRGGRGAKGASKAKTTAPRRKKAVADDGDDDDDDDDIDDNDYDVVKKGSKSTKSKGKTKNSRRIDGYDDDDDDDDDDWGGGGDDDMCKKSVSNISVTSRNKTKPLRRKAKVEPLDYDDDDDDGDNYGDADNSIGGDSIGSLAEDSVPVRSMLPRKRGKR